jgi:signal transduction histidine kinase/ligand-binding sensor domain-containing protein
MTQRLVLAVAVTLAAAAPARALDPSRAASQYVLTKWGSRELQSNTVHALTQTRDHYLWVGTSTGVVRFDGARFTIFSNRNTPDFGDGGVTSLHQGPDGTLYLGTTSGGVVQHKDGAFAELPVRAGTGYVSSLLTDHDGGLWIVRHGRTAYRWKDGAFKILYTSGQGPGVIAEDKDGGLWIGTRLIGLLRYTGKAGDARSEAFDVFAREGMSEHAIQALLFDRNGALWIGTSHGLLRRNGARVDRFTTREGLSHDNVTALLEDRDGNLWIGTAGGGLNRLTNGRFSRLTSEEGLSDDDIRSLLEDHEGNLWVGTADGLNCVADGRFVTYGRFEGLDVPAAPSVIGSRRGGVWVGTGTAEVVHLREDGTVRKISLPGGPGRDAVIALYEARDGSLWVSLDNGRVFQVRDGATVEHTPTNAGSDFKVPIVFEDEGGTVFFVTGYGLARVKGRVMTRYRPEIPLLGYPHHVLLDRQGTLWLAASRGLVRVRDGKSTILTEADGLPQRRVRWMIEDDDGTLWLATIGGLAHWKDGRFRALTVQQGLPENYLRFVVDDGRGHLWMNSTGQFFRVDKREVLEVLDGQRTRVSPLIFDASDGLRTTETILSNSPGFRAGDGRLWFATAKGVSVVDPRRVDVDEPAPDVAIEGVTVDRDAVRRAEYPPGRGEVTIDYTALSFRAPAKVRFRHRLEGLDDDWVEAGTRRSAYYSNLPPGDYRFSVMASNTDGVWNGRATELGFRVQPPFHRRWSFYAAVLAAALLAGFAAHRLRLGQMRARFAAIIGERTRIARELHDTLSQGLAGTGIQIDTAIQTIDEGPQAAREHMGLARLMVRTTLAEVRRSIWVLRAQTSKDSDGLGPTLESSLRQLTADSGLEATIDITGRPRALPGELERNLLRIAHEAVTNAVRHAEAKSLTIGLEFDSEAVSLRVADDGRGFDPGTVNGEHFGITGMSERASGMGGELEVQSRPGEGTRLRCRLPYRCRIDTTEIATRLEAEE